MAVCLSEAVLLPAEESVPADSVLSVVLVGPVLVVSVGSVVLVGPVVLEEQVCIWGNSTTSVGHGDGSVCVGRWVGGCEGEDE